MHTVRCVSTRTQNCHAKQSGKEDEIQKFMYRGTVQQMWNTKCKIIPAITGATGTVTKYLGKNLEAILT